MRNFIHLMLLLFFFQSTTRLHRAIQDDLSSPSKTVLATGNAAFQDPISAERLLNQGYFVICLDSLLTGNINNITHLMECDRFRFVHQDVIEPYDPSGKN